MTDLNERPLTPEGLGELLRTEAPDVVWYTPTIARESYAIYTEKPSRNGLVHYKLRRLVVLHPAWRIEAARVRHMDEWSASEIHAIHPGAETWSLLLSRGPSNPRAYTDEEPPAPIRQRLRRALVDHAELVDRTRSANGQSALLSIRLDDILDIVDELLEDDDTRGSAA